MWAQMGQITNTAWKNTCGTLPGKLQQWHPCERQDQDGSQTKLPLQDGWRRTWTDVPLLMKCQINNQLKPDLPQHKPGSPKEKGKLVPTYNFAASPFLHYMISIRVAVPTL